MSAQQASPRIYLAIDPKSRICVEVGRDSEEARKDWFEGGYILVPVSAEHARRSFGERIDDIFAIAESPA